MQRGINNQGQQKALLNNPVKKLEIDKITYVGPIIGRGDNLGVSGTVFVYLIAKAIKGEVKMFLPTKNLNSETSEIDLGDNVKHEWAYRVNSIRSLITTARKIAKTESSMVIFNFFPTSLGDNRLRNFIWSMVPFYLRLNGIKVIMIFHNSVSTSNWKTLGYTGILDKIGAKLFQIIEKGLFKITCSVFLLESYKNIIQSKFGLNVQAVTFKYIDSLTAFIASGYTNLKIIEIPPNDKIKTIHIHGNFGPQKDIEFALFILSKIAAMGIKFRTLISGSINTHFPAYKIKMDEIIKEYKEIISEVIIPISESNIFDVFRRSDILLLPYRASGGRSGVMDLGAFFDLDVVVFRHIEFKEQASWYNNVHVINPEELQEILLSLLNKPNPKKLINVDDKIGDSLNMMVSLLKYCCATERGNK